MMMQKNCDLELRLFPTSYDSESSDTSVVESSSSGNEQQKEESQRITIFYNGKFYISSDVTHIQAKSIISMAANRETEEKSSSNGSDPQNGSTRFRHHHLPNPKASMKRSLQTFLQKRKTRIQSSSPYHHHSRP